MPSVRTYVTLVFALTLSCAAPAAAQPPLGPFCLKMTAKDSEPSTFKIFALPMGESQYLLSATTATLPWSGSANLTNGGTLSFFTLIAGTPFPGSTAPGGIVSGGVNLQTGLGQGNCSTIDPPAVKDPPPCTNITEVTFAAVSCK